MFKAHQSVRVDGISNGTIPDVPANATLFFFIVTPITMIFPQANLFNVELSTGTLLHSCSPVSKKTYREDVFGFHFMKPYAKVALTAKENVHNFTWFAWLFPRTCTANYVTTKASDMMTVKIMQPYSLDLKVCMFLAHTGSGEVNFTIPKGDNSFQMWSRADIKKQREPKKYIKSTNLVGIKSPLVAAAYIGEQTKKPMRVRVKMNNATSSSFIRLGFTPSEHESDEMFIPLYNITKFYLPARDDPIQVYFGPKSQTFEEKAEKLIIEEKKDISLRKLYFRKSVKARDENKKKTDVPTPKPTQSPVPDMRIDPVILMGFVLIIVCVIGCTSLFMLYVLKSKRSMNDEEDRLIPAGEIRPMVLVPRPVLPPMYGSPMPNDFQQTV